MPPAGFEPAIPAKQQPQTHALHCAATWNEAPLSQKPAKNPYSEPSHIKYVATENKSLMCAAVRDKLVFCGELLLAPTF
jgi:hypothetical protein